MSENHSKDRLVKEVLMMELVMHTEKNDTMFHMEKTGMVILVFEIDVGGMTADVVDKLTCSSDDVQPKQVDLRCTHALTELHWHVIHAVPDRHEFDQLPASSSSNTTTDTTSDETGTKSGRTVTLTAEDMQKKKNDVKARTTLLLSLPDEHQLQDTSCAYIASQSSGSQIKFEDISQIDEDDIEEMDIKWNMALLSMREDKAPRNQDRRRRDNYRQGYKAEEQALKALMAIDKVGWDWSYMANDEEDHTLVADEVAPTEFALMANTSAESKKLETLKEEKEGVDGQLAGLLKASKDLDNLIDSQRNFPPVNRKFSPGSRNFPIANRTFPNASRKFPTGSIKCSTADMGMKGKAGSSQNNIDNKGYWDSGCSRHMTGNISYLSDFESFNGGYVSFSQGGCKITGKRTIKTGKLEFENVYFMKDLKYNLFSVSQIYDNKNSVLFTDSECIVL
nr:ribonuclease H-like domain-containing protein [Tanacetum cinerariifolium]